MRFLLAAAVAAVSRNSIKECVQFCGDFVNPSFLLSSSDQFVILGSWTCSCRVTTDGDGQAVTKQCLAPYNAGSCNVVGQTDCNGTDDVNCIDFCASVHGRTSNYAFGCTSDGPATGPNDPVSSCSWGDGDISYIYCKMGLRVARSW